MSNANGTSHPLAETTHDDPNAVEAAPALPVGELLDGKRLVVIGGTGFLGKVYLSLLLSRYPNIGHVFLMVRPKAGMDSEQRFWAEVAPSPTFDPIREANPGRLFEAFMMGKITPIPGDLSEDHAGIPEEILEELANDGVDAVVNSSGLVDFNPPIDKAIQANAFGIKNLINLARRLGDVPIHHTSTCYVAGNRSGVIPERDPRLHPFPKAGDLDNTHWDPEQEVAECVDLVEMARHRCEDAFRQSAFLDEAKRNLEKKGEPTTGPALDDELKKVKRRFIDGQLSGFGTERALFWGWPNTYTYSKSIGEQLLLNSGLPVSIGRPAVIESSIEYPFPGWNEGINTSAPLIYLGLNGHVQYPSKPGLVLDFIPVDMVAAGMIANLAALLQRTHDPVYQFGSSDSNPCTLERFVALTGLAKRRRYRQGKGNPVVDFLQGHIEPVIVSPETYKRQGAGAVGRFAKNVGGLLRKAAVGPAKAPLKGVAKGLEGYAKVAEKNGEIFDLFLPFIADNFFEFRCDKTRGLFERMPEEDQGKLPWYPEKIDWRDWMLNIHIPGLEKWVEPLIEEKMTPKRKPLRAYRDLWSLVDEAAERHDLVPALQRLEKGDAAKGNHEDHLATLSFRDLRERCLAVAGTLTDAGVSPGDRVVISGKNHPAWPVVYFGILRAGATAVPVDPEMEPESFARIVESSKARVVVWDTHAAEESSIAVQALGALRYFDLQALAFDLGSADRAPALEVDPQAVASLIFTSGTTGNPKGVMLTHENFTHMLGSLMPLFPLGEKDAALSVLPLHHTFEFSCGLLLPLSRGARITYLDELTGERLLKGLHKGNVTAMVGVPALWQLLERRITSQIGDRGAVAKAFFDFASDLNRNVGKNVGIDMGRVLFGPVHAGLGGKLKYLVSGGAALPKETHELFQGLGLHLSEGYGLTEAAPVLTVAKADPKAKGGQVGKAVPGVELKIDSPDDNGVGEVLAKGANVMAGYADNEEATKQVMTDDGWLRTGDLGKLDRKGRLTIVGRAKEVIVSATGENVYPDDVEALIGDVEHIKELSILGMPDHRGGERVAVIAVPEEDDTLDHRARFQRAEQSLRKVLKGVPKQMRPVVVHVYDADLPRTATRKVKRNECRVILEKILAVTEADQLHALPGEHSVMTEVRHAVASVSGHPEKDVHPHTRLGADLDFDSLTLVELVAALDAIAAKEGRPPVNGELVLQCETVGELEGVVSGTFGGDALVHESRTRRIDGLDEAEVDPEPVLPEGVRTGAKDLMRGVQMGFYQRGMRTRVVGRANIPKNRVTIVVANHVSHLDLGAVKFALGDYAKDLATLAAKDYFFETWRRHYFQNLTNVIPVDRQLGGLDSLEPASEAIAQGKILLLFPEGTRSKSGELQSFRPGVGHLALKHGVDILPVFVKGTYEAMPKGQRLPSKRSITVRIGEPMDAQLFMAKTEDLRGDQAARAVARAAREAVRCLRDGEVFELGDFEFAEPTEPEQHPMEALFDYLAERFVPGEVSDPVRYYFSLGDDTFHKWTVQVDNETCEVKKGKPSDGQADCVLKTDANTMERIVRQAYVPSPAEFMSGQVKTNDVELLQRFVQIFNLV